MGNNIRLQFDSSIENIENINDSFSSGVLRICYTGKNKNGSFISKDTIERALPTIFNCPIVCNYDIESDTIGGHDVDIVRTDDGAMKLINMTSAVGVVPSTANTWWSVIEDNGVEHEYLMTEVILWKRSPAYQKILDDGITSQSMEILVKSGQKLDGVYVIDNFVFTAFCLLGDGIEPCFESASLQMFDKSDIAQQFTIMMQEFKETFSIATAQADNDIHPQIYSEGGEEVLEQKKALAAEYGLEINELDFSVEDMTVEELREKFEAMKLAKSFALEQLFRDELCSTLEAEQVTTYWGQESRYWLWDYDHEASEVYAYDTTDWNIYGFPYSMDGDHVVIDFNGKKRMKLSLAPFDEGSQSDPVSGMFTKIAEKYTANDTQWAEKYQIASDTITSLENELGTLRQFKTDVEGAKAKGERDEVFAQFEDLVGVEAFELLKGHSMEYSKEDLEEKCYAIRGRNSAATAKFSLEQKSPKLPIEKKSAVLEPYGGIFTEYGIALGNQHN